MSSNDWTFWGMLSGWFATVAAWIAMMLRGAENKGRFRAKAKQMDVDHAARIEDHEQRLRTLESLHARLARIEQDVHWIRESLTRTDKHP